MVEKKATRTQVPSEGNYHHKYHGKPADHPVASGVTDPAKVCCWRTRGVACGELLAKDSYAYCDKHKIEVRRSV